MRPKLIVWYNTKCPVCNGGIKWQDSRLVRAAQAGAIEFRDINLEPAALARCGSEPGRCADGRHRDARQAGDPDAVDG